MCPSFETASHELPHRGTSNEGSSNEGSQCKCLCNINGNCFINYCNVLSIGTPKKLIFPLGPIIFTCPKIKAYYRLFMIRLNTEAPKIH